MKFNTKLGLFTFLFLFMGLGFWSCDDDDSEIDAELENLSIEYPLVDGEEYNALLYTTKATVGESVEYSTIKEYVSEEPVFEGSLTSIVLKSAISENDTIPAEFLEIDKQKGTLKVLDKKSIKAGMYSFNIQLNTIKQSEIKEGAFSLKVVETSLNYPLVTMFQGKAMATEAAEITGGIVAESFALKNAPEGISIHPETGVISAEDGNTVEIAEHVMDVVVTCSEGEITYKNAITINCEKEIIMPADLLYENQSIVIGQELSVLPTVTGNELEFVLATDAPDAISINAETGELSLEANNDLAIGEYDIVVTASNSKGSVEGTLHLTVTALVPANLVYDPATISIKMGEAFTSATPSIENGENVTYSISNSDQFTIDSKTGVISVLEDNTIPAGDYNLNVLVAYEGGAVTFESIYKVTVIDGAVAPADLSYEDKEIVEGEALTANPASITGTELTFELAAGSPAQFTIDASTGKIKLTEGNDLAVGEYTITVKASNTKGSTEGTLKVVVKEKITVLAPTNLVYSTADTTVITRSNYKSVEPSIDNGEGVSYTISDDTNFAISSTGVISFKEGVHVPGAIYDLTITAVNAAGSTTAAYKLTVREMRYDTNPITGTIAAGVTANVPTLVNIGDGGAFELRGVYYSGTLEGVEYSDVLLEGGADNFIGDVVPVSDALGLTKKGKVDLNKLRDALNAPKSGWDGSIATVPGSENLKPGTYELKVRYTLDGEKYEFKYVLKIILS